MSALRGEETEGVGAERRGSPADVRSLDALEGLFIHEAGHGGLVLHATDARPREDLEVRFDAASALTICICLDGAVDAEIGGRRLEVDASNGPVGKLWNLTRDEPVRRRSAAWRRDRKVVVMLQPQWFADADVGASMPEAQRMRASHLAIFDWRPSRRSLRCAELILSSGERSDGLGKIAREALALEIACEALAALPIQAPERGGAVGEPSPSRDAAPATRDVARARSARAYIEQNLGAELCLGSIARACGMSVSTLQRVFKNSFGVTVVEHLRRRRLEIAREALHRDGASVAEAARVAGYTSAASFATAYQREFGHPPSHAGK